MTKVKCQNCGHEFPMNETIELEGSILCKDCSKQFLPNRKDIQVDDIKQQIDPTICSSCGKDNENISLTKMAGLPVCPDCESFFKNRPFPPWIKVSLIGVIALVIFSLVWNMRFIQAYIDMRRSVKVATQYDIERATALMNSASQRVPESKDLRTMASFYQGILFLQQEKWEHALAMLNSCVGKVPPEFNLDRLIMSAQMGIAFDNKDYDRLLILSLQMSKENPDDPICTAQVSSAYACKYAVTGDEQFKQESLKLLEQAGAILQEDENFKEYEQRILHRLHTREIIKPKEFMQRFPNGWKEP